MKKITLCSAAAVVLCHAFPVTIVHAQDSGVSTGTALTASKPRTVGIVDPAAPVVFEDVTGTTALASFRHVAGSASKDYIIDTPSGGVAIFDYDGDGLPDVYLLNGSTFDAETGKAKPPRAALYRNRGKWKFEDVTDKAGVANERWGFGVAVADYDNDGDLDMFVGNWGVSRLYRNNGNGTFTDVAEQLGVARKGWSTGASFGDYDGDGRLDLFVPGYVEFSMASLPPKPGDAAGASGVGQNFCQFRGVPVMCGPRGLKGERDTLYHQKADGMFEDVTEKLKIDEPRYYGFSSAFIRADDDKLVDLVVVNDSTPKQLYINKGGTFEETGYQSGLALNENGREQAGMGLAIGDYDNDGRADVYITNFSDDSNTLYHNDGDGVFTDETLPAGMGEPTIPFLGWGTTFVDYDNDGWQDVLIANGHVYPVVDGQPWGTSFAQQMVLFRNLGTGRFQRVGAAPGSGLAKAWPARGMATGDLDGDGRIDAVVNTCDGAPVVLRNVTSGSGHWIGVTLTADTSRKSPRDATGATVIVTAGKLKLRRDLVSGAGYCSQSDRVLHFGLGAAASVDQIEVVWPDGQSTVTKKPALDRITAIDERKTAGVGSR